jgi:membrane protease YdiL (CAAX protease family)
LLLRGAYRNGDSTRIKENNLRTSIGANEAAATYIIAFLGAYVLSVIWSFFSNILPSWVFIWGNYGIHQVGLLIAMYAYSRIRRFDLLRVAKVNRPLNKRQYALLPFIAFFAVVAFLPAALGFSKLLNLIGYGGGMSVPVGGTSAELAWVYMVNLVVVVALPAICEEILMRGVVTGGLSSYSVKFGIFISALMFSLMHANPMQTVHQFLLGIVLAIVYLSCRSVIPCIIVHALNNLISVTCTTFLPQVDMIIENLGAWNFLTGIASFAVGSLALAILLYWLYRFSKPKQPKFSVAETRAIFEEYTFTASMDVPSTRKTQGLRDTFVFIKSLFGKNGWRRIGSSLEYSGGVIYIGKAQPMLSVWIALGFDAFYWIVTFVQGLL